MTKEFLPYDVVRNNALKLACKIYSEGFVPDVLYCSLRGGAYMANVISEYFKIVRKGSRPVLYAAVVARSYNDVRTSSDSKCNSRVLIDGWTYPPERLRPGDKVMLVDDIFDTGNTINALADIILNRGVPREDLKIVVHDFKHFAYKKSPPIVPDYFCRKFEIANPEEDRWIHYMSHELVGLSQEDLEAHYFKEDAELRPILERVILQRSEKPC